jgi:hypothetical protein
VEGVLKIGANPAPAGTKVSLGSFGWSANAARSHFNYATTTDANGHYVLDRVPAGLVKIDTKVSKTGATLEQYTGASPGKVTHFNIGGSGRPIIGKVVLPSHLDLKRLNKWPGIDSISYFRRDVPWPNKQPLPYATVPDEEREDSVRAWRKTQEAIDNFKNEYRCEIDPAADGTFRLDDVPPGNYVLTLSFMELGEKESGGEVARKVVKVEVPESPAPTDQPLDLGEIKVGDEGL